MHGFIDSSFPKDAEAQFLSNYFFAVKTFSYLKYICLGSYKL
jgi:hypothetical protein